MREFCAIRCAVRFMREFFRFMRELTSLVLPFRDDSRRLQIFNIPVTLYQ